MKFFAFLFFLLLCSLAKAQIGELQLGTVSLNAANIGSVRSIGKSPLAICLPGEGSCSIAYRFIGNGDWTTEENWLGNKIPPVVLPAGNLIIIDPENGGECLLNIFQTIAPGANLELIPTKRLKILTSLVFKK